MQTTPQMMMNVHRPRLQHPGGDRSAALPHRERHRTADGGRVPADVRAELARRGHECRCMDDWTMFVGGGQGIMVDPDSGAFMGGADPRRDGYAMAW